MAHQEREVPKVVLRTILVDPTDFQAASKISLFEQNGFEIIQRYYSVEEALKRIADESNFDVVFINTQEVDEEFFEDFVQYIRTGNDRVSIITYSLRSQDISIHPYSEPLLLDTKFVQGIHARTTLRKLLGR